MSLKQSRHTLRLKITITQKIQLCLWVIFLTFQMAAVAMCIQASQI